MPEFARIAGGFIVALAVAAAARRSRALSASGMVAATFVGTAAVAAGWDWGALLIGFFVASSLLSRVQREHKARATGSIVHKGDERDAVQVLANGAAFAVAAVGHAVSPAAAWQALGAGALAAATADTWATEIGLLSPRAPRSILTFRAVPRGTSGGVTMLGFMGGVFGAAFIELAALVLGWPQNVVVAVVAGGIAGTLADSLFGATLQQRRWCDTCHTATERPVHGCGAATRVTGGFAWFDNDGVNAACTLVGAGVAWIIARHL
ncbi:MAG TPA: DUF92 domain-containing protein [Gemmatimonadaceae bacterium]|nr:DUF92 domain-containing protein [Gemmatimonadaceae bacterium]